MASYFVEIMRVLLELMKSKDESKLGLRTKATDTAGVLVQVYGGKNGPVLEEYMHVRRMWSFLGSLPCYE